MLLYTDLDRERYFLLSAISEQDHVSMLAPLIPGIPAFRGMTGVLFFAENRARLTPHGENLLHRAAAILDLTWVYSPSIELDNINVDHHNRLLRFRLRMDWIHPAHIKTMLYLAGHPGHTWRTLARLYGPAAVADLDDRGLISARPLFGAACFLLPHGVELLNRTIK